MDVDKLLEQIITVIQQAQQDGQVNEQWFINFLDNLNAISVAEY